MLINNNFRIRKLETRDAKFITDLRSDISTNSMLGHFIFVSEESQKEWISSINSSKDAMYFLFEKKGGDNWQKIGITRFNHIDFINRSASVGGDIAAENRGNGYAKEMFRLIFSLGFDYLNLNRLWLHVLENNHKAIDLYTKIGFVQEGVQRAAVFRGSKYVNYLMMSILAEEYQQF